MKFDFAPHLAGRMLPELFSACPELRKPRFPDDPWARQPHLAAWYWMHAPGCPNGLYRARAISPALLEPRTAAEVLAPTPRRPAPIFSGYRAPRRNQQQRELFGRAS